jgi:hypothetical protein
VVGANGLLALPPVTFVIFVPAVIFPPVALLPAIFCALVKPTPSATQRQIKAAKIGII